VPVPVVMTTADICVHRGHVAQDLNPYSCIYEDCADSNELFTTKDEWMNHTTNHHSIERWVCDECTFRDDLDEEPVFDNADDWEQHMSECHKEKCDGHQLALLSSLCRRRLTQLTECPLCKRSTGLVRPDKDEHIAEHLHEWALRALPWDSKTGKDDSGNSQAIAGSNDDLAEMSQMSEPSGSDEPDDEDVTAAIRREGTRWQRNCDKLGDHLAAPLGDSLTNFTAYSTEIAWASDTKLADLEATLQHLLKLNQILTQTLDFLSTDHAADPQQLDEVLENLRSNAHSAVEEMMRMVDHTSKDADSEEANLSEEEDDSDPFPIAEGYNIPPTEGQKSKVLWNARKHVLNSQNVSMQLSWARDVLTWVKIAAESRVRLNELDGGDRQLPRVEDEMNKDALNIVTYLADQEHPEALYVLGKILEFGKFGNRVKKREAYAKYNRASALGHARSEYRIGMMYEQSNDFEKAHQHYEIAVEREDPAAHYRLGMIYLLGQHNLEQNQMHGLTLVQKAADTADEDAPQGPYVYGMLIARGLPDIDVPEFLLPPNDGSAKMYIEKAAYLGFAKAQLKMGQAYELCQLGCDFNPIHSLHYYRLAAEQGTPEAELGISRWFLVGYEGDFEKNEELTFTYAQRAAHAKLATAEFAMGYYYEIGIYVEKDIKLARQWYEKAAEQGNKDATDRLASLNDPLGTNNPHPQKDARYIAVGIDLGTV
jgi:TPR repeat protein